MKIGHLNIVIINELDNHFSKCAICDCDNRKMLHLYIECEDENRHFNICDVCIINISAK